MRDPNPEQCCGDYGPSQVEPCQIPSDYPPCSSTVCGGGDFCSDQCVCNDYCCYQQPPRTQPIRPNANLFRSNAPLETDTIYKRSYAINFGDCFAAAKPIRPNNNITGTKEPMEKCTVHKLSYLPHCGAKRPAPIHPKDNGLKFQGPVYTVTSQKHDFVAKGYCRRQPIKPCPGICKTCDPLEKCTINKLSYMPVDIGKYPPPKPIVQSYNYVRPTGPGEKCSIQKLSYLPICLPAKEPMPWAEKVRCVPPNYENLCTTYNLSYMPNCGTSRLAPILPINGLKMLGCDKTEGSTVYKLSYTGVDGRCCRPAPILPINGLEMPSGPMEKCTIQKLSYQPNNCVPRTAPIRSRENGILDKATGPMYFITTQKHDFVAKPLCRRSPIKPVQSIIRPTEGLEKCTINKLSYMPVNICEYRRPAPILPRPGVCKPAGPMERCTTYKLSYLPNCPQVVKEPMPWANASNYVKPTGPMERCTVQKLSYRPPGVFSRCRGCHPNGNKTVYPKAGICN